MGEGVSKVVRILIFKILSSIQKRLNMPDNKKCPAMGSFENKSKFI
jgi:hypothetical protein